MKKKYVFCVSCTIALLAMTSCKPYSSYYGNYNVVKEIPSTFEDDSLQGSSLGNNVFEGKSFNSKHLLTGMSADDFGSLTLVKQQSITSKALSSCKYLGDTSNSYSFKFDKELVTSEVVTYEFSKKKVICALGDFSNLQMLEAHQEKSFRVNTTEINKKNKLYFSNFVNNSPFFKAIKEKTNVNSVIEYSDFTNSVAYPNEKNNYYEDLVKENRNSETTLVYDLTNPYDYDVFFSFNVSIRLRAYIVQTINYHYIVNENVEEKDINFDYQFSHYTCDLAIAFDFVDNSVFKADVYKASQNGTYELIDNNEVPGTVYFGL